MPPVDKAKSPPPSRPEPSRRRSTPPRDPVPLPRSPGPISSSSKVQAPAAPKPPTSPSPGSPAASKDEPLAPDVNGQKPGPKSPAPVEIIHDETFAQILEMDDDEDEDDHGFSRGIVLNYFDQAITTFDEMDQALEAKDLLKLSDLGHFLKGSSAALGVAKVQWSCEKMQHYGKLRDEVNSVDLDETTALEKISTLLVQVKEEHAEAEKWLKKYYENLDNGGSGR